VVARLCAVQAQDYAGARWALGLRAKGPCDADVEQAFDAGKILRTHVLRPTWHFVVPADIRWMLALTAPRVRAVSAYYDRQHGVDARALRLSRKVFERALRGGRHLTRPQLASALEGAGVSAAGPRLAHLMLHAELDALVCSGPRQGKQFTYALLEERVPRVKELARDEALAELAHRYFSSHGPATLRDFVWWSGLTTRDARAGIGMASALDHESVDGRAYWFVPSRATRRSVSPSVHLLPNYDEYVIAYKDRDVILDPTRPSRRGPLDPFAHLLMIDGRLRGTWKRPSGSASGLRVRPLWPLTKDERRALARAAESYTRFIGVPTMLSLV
jgi:hypothetical protein